MGQVADPLHVVKVANTKLDECRRRVQNETLGHRGRRDDPLYRCRRLLSKAHERLEGSGEDKLLGLLRAGDPKGEVTVAWHAKKAVRDIYSHNDAVLAREWADELIVDMASEDKPVEVPLPGPHPAALEDPHRRLARREADQRSHRGGQQPHQEGQAGGLRLPQLQALPDPVPALRRTAQLGSTGHHHTPVKSEEPPKVSVTWSTAVLVESVKA